MMRKGLFALALCGGLSACGAGPDAESSSEADAENVGQATFELMTVPAGVGCLRITVSGSSSVTRDFTLATPASTASLDMARLPLGTVTINGLAYATTCGVDDPIYLADPTSATLSAGVISNIALTFRKNNPVKASVNFVGNVQAISAQDSASYAVIDGTLYRWGYSPAGAGSAVKPTAVTGITGVVDVNSGPRSSSPCAIKSDGTVWCFGNNAYGQISSSNVGTTLTTPVKYGGGTGYTLASAGAFFNCAANPLGKQLYCSGDNSDWQLANGVPVTGTTTPAVTFTGGISSISLGYTHVCLVDGMLTVRCVGNNDGGQLGDGTAGIDRSAWTTTLTGATSASSGTFHSCAVMSDGTARCWGTNNQGQLGDSTQTTRLAPVAVTGLTGVAKLSLGDAFSCALLNNGSVKCWGFNTSGQLGDGTVTSRNIPTTVLGIPDPVTMLATGFNHACAVTTRQDIYCWGDNMYGELGNGGFINSTKAVKVTLP